MLRDIQEIKYVLSYRYLIMSNQKSLLFLLENI